MANGTLQFPSLNLAQDQTALDQSVADAQAILENVQQQQQLNLSNISSLRQQQFGGSGDSSATKIGKSIGTALFGQSAELTKEEEKQAALEQALIDAQSTVNKRRELAESTQLLNQATQRQDANVLRALNTYDATGDINSVQQILSGVVQDPDFLRAMALRDGTQVSGVETTVSNSGDLLVSLVTNKGKTVAAPVSSLMSDNGAGYIAQKTDAEALRQKEIANSQDVEAFSTQQRLREAQALQAEQEAGLAEAQTVELLGSKQSIQTAEDAVSAANNIRALSTRIREIPENAFGASGSISEVAVGVGNVLAGIGNALGMPEIGRALGDIITSESAEEVAIDAQQVQSLGTMLANTTAALFGQSGRGLSDKDQALYQQVIGDPASVFKSKDSTIAALDLVDSLLNELVETRTTTARQGINQPTAQQGNVAPEGTVINMPDGTQQIKRNGEWQPL